MQAELHCREYSTNKPCRVKKLTNLNLEVGLWGCAPWIALWPILVFFAPVPEKEKIKICLASIGFLMVDLFAAVTQSSGLGGTTLVDIIMIFIGIPLVLTNLIFSYKALFKEMKNRNALYSILSEDSWRKGYYCLVHNELLEDDLLDY
jgi:hypothetical protein